MEIIFIICLNKVTQCKTLREEATIKNQHNSWQQQTETKKAKNPSNSGCLGMFLLFITQVILLYICIISGIGNTAYESFLLSSHLDSLGTYLESSVTPFQLSIVAICILLLGVIIFLRYQYLLHKNAARNAIAGESISEYDKMRTKMFSVLSLIKRILDIFILFISIAPAYFVLYTVVYNQPSSKGLVAATIISFSAYAIFFLWLVVRGIVSIIEATLAANWKKNQRPTKEQIILSELGKMCGENCGYDPSGRFSADPFESKVIRQYDRFISNDYIYGSYRGLSFEQLDVFLQDNKDFNPNLKNYYTFASSDAIKKMNAFKGRWIIVHQLKTSSGRFCIISKNASDEELERFKIIPSLTEVFLEDGEFNRHFLIYAENPHDVFYIMTPQLIERLKTFSDMGTRQKDFSIRLGFYHNRIHLIISGLVDAFEQLYGAQSQDLSATEESARNIVRRDLNLITDFIDSLFAPNESL